MARAGQEEGYNLVVIGGGSAGLVSALIAATVKAKVALIERGPMGGDCLNTGCVPSKALIKSGRVLAEAQRAAAYGLAGLKVDATGVDFAAVMRRVQEVIKEIAPHDSRERYTALGVECLQGEARLIDKHTVEVNGRRLQAKAVIIATGGEPAVPELPGLAPYLTSETLWQMPERPKRLLVLGGGAIGCELAQALQRLGSAVTIVERGARLLSREDGEAAALVEGRLRQEGVQVYCNTVAKSLRRSIEGRELTVQTRDQDEAQVLGFDEILVAVGRKARTDWLDLQRLGLKLNAHGTLAVDEYLCANGDNIYACGDVTGPFQLTHAASHQAWYCAINALFRPFKRFKVDYRVIPRVTFTTPEVASVGYTEDSAKAAGLRYEVVTYQSNDLDRAIAESEAYGFVKVLTVPRKDRILGVTIAGAHAGEMIGEYVLAMKHKLGVQSILSTVHAYPTFIEANKYAAGAWKRAHAPYALLPWVERFHRWRRG